MERIKLNTLIEKEVHKLIFAISEHVVDFVHIFARRNKIQLEENTMKETLRIVQLAIKDGFQMRLGTFNKGIDEALTEFTQEENPTLSDKKEKPRKKSE